MSNLDRLRSAMAEQNLPALLVTDNTNIRWLTGFTGSFGVVLVTDQEACLITDSRYTLRASEEAPDFAIEIFQRPKTLDATIGDKAEQFGISTLGFETNQSYATHTARAEALPKLEWVEEGGILADLRKIKTPAEVAKIRDACKLADQCLEHAVRMLQPGVREYDIHLDIEFFYRRNGAKLAFDPIVVSGPNSASPHGTAGERALQKGDFVTIDCGAQIDGYCSDITRTFVIGEASERHREIYNQVLKAEVECCSLLVDGANGHDIDTRAREILDEKDLAQYFGHGLGHGLGMATHDPGRLSQNVDQPIKNGMVFTVEPGVYIAGFGGVRIEDDVLVTPDGPEILTSFPKELMIL